MKTFTVSRLFILISVVIFSLAVFHVAPGGVLMLPLGLAFFTASFLLN